MQFKQWILNETDWPLFLTEGEEQVLALTSSIIAAALELASAAAGSNYRPGYHAPVADELASDLKDVVELKYLPAFAFIFAGWVGSTQFKNDGLRANVRGYFDKLKILVDKGKIKWAKEGQATVKGVVIDDNKGNKETVTDYLKFTEIIDGMYNLMKPSTRSGKNDARPDSDAKPIFSKNGLDIYESNSPQACIKYGEGYGFCISQPGGTMWQSYRDTQASTFYFVFDRTLDKSNPLHIVVVDITEHGPQLTDANNDTGNIAKYESDEGYLNHLYGRGVPEDLFKNIPKTPEEEAESLKLGHRDQDLDFFKRLSYEEKSKYIGRGHNLTDEQFDLLWDNNTKDLLNQYVNIGIKLNDHQAEKVLTKKDLKESYLRKRWIAYELGRDAMSKWVGEQANQAQAIIDWADITVNAFRKLEFDNLKQEQQESIKKEIENIFDRVEEKDVINSPGAFIEIYLICEKGHHDIAELAKRRLKKYVQGSGHARELMQSVGHHQGTRQASGFRDSIPFVHAIIKDVLVSDPLGGIQKKSRKDINLYLQKAVDAVVANFFDAIDYLRPPQVVHGSEHAQWLNSKIDMFEKRLKNNNWPGIWGKMSSASRYAVSDDKYETQAVQIIDILVKAGADTTQAKDSLRLGIKRFNANYQRTRTDILSGRLPRHNLMITDTTSGDKLSLATEKIKVHYLEFLIRYLDGLASPTKDVS